MLTITNNSPVDIGDTIILSVPAADEVTYYWFGPYSFHGTGPTQKIVAYDYAVQGTYWVQYFTADNCVSDPNSTVVTISAPIAPCNPGTNHIKLTGVVNFTASTITTYDNAPDNYTLTGVSGENSISMSFSSEPASGVYAVTYYSGYFYPGYAAITIHAQKDDWLSVYYNGSVYVSNINGIISATFCDISFQSSYGSSTANGNLTTQ